MVTLLSGIGIKLWNRRAPYMIVAMVIGSVLAYVFNQIWGIEVTQISSVGALPQSLPPLSAPDFTLDTIKNLAPAVLAVTLFALTEAVSIARSLGARTGQLVDGNQEFIGQGLSNIIGSFFSGYVATGSFNRSGLNFQAGAETPLAAVFAGVLLMIIVLLVAPLTAYLPDAAMAGILFLVAWGLIDFREIKHVIFTSKSETSVLAVTFFGALFLELEFAIFSGVMLSLVLYLNRASKPSLTTLAPDPNDIRHSLSNVDDSSLIQCPQSRIMRIDGSLFFGAVNYVANALQRNTEKRPEQKHILLICNTISYIDLAGAEFLVQEARRMKKLGGRLYLSNLPPQMSGFLAKGHFDEEIGKDYIFESKSEAIQAMFIRLNRDICRCCDKRIFNECASIAYIKKAA
jgi:SulP family sulfate permease